MRTLILLLCSGAQLVAEVVVVVEEWLATQMHVHKNTVLVVEYLIRVSPGKAKSTDYINPYCSDLDSAVKLFLPTTR